MYGKGKNEHKGSGDTASRLYHGLARMHLGTLLPSPRFRYALQHLSFLHLHTPPPAAAPVAATDPSRVLFLAPAACLCGSCRLDRRRDSPAPSPVPVLLAGMYLCVYV